MAIAFTCPHCGFQTNVADEYAGQSGPCARCGKTITVPLPGQVGYGVDSPASLPRSRSLGSNVAIAALAAMAGLCCCGGLIGIPVMVPAVQAAREAAHRAECTANLRRIGVALQQYVNEYQSLPPAYVADAQGRPRHSWRALLLPYLDPPLAARYRFDEPWDGPNNRRLHSQMPAVYRCPSEEPRSTSLTSYVVLVGPRTAFPGSKSVAPGDITDGARGTLTVVEVSGADINWLEPRDLPAGGLNFSINAPRGDEISSLHPDGAMVLTADGQAHFLPDWIEQPRLKGLSTIAGSEDVLPP